MLAALAIDEIRKVWTACFLTANSFMNLRRFTPQYAPQ